MPEMRPGYGLGRRGSKDGAVAVLAALATPSGWRAGRIDRSPSAWVYDLALGRFVWLATRLALKYQPDKRSALKTR
jgi:hypothetical protein